jgi:hypothetical protein
VLAAAGQGARPCQGREADPRAGQRGAQARPPPRHPGQGNGDPGGAAQPAAGSALGRHRRLRRHRPVPDRGDHHLERAGRPPEFPVKEEVYVKPVLTLDRLSTSGRNRTWLALFGLTRTLNVAAHCASLTSISTGHLPDGQAVNPAVDHYGSEGWGSSPFERAHVSPGRRASHFWSWLRPIVHTRWPDVGI